MAFLVVLIGFGIAALGIAGTAATRRLSDVIRSWPPRTLFGVAVGLRLVFGALLLFAAPACRFSAAVSVLGALALVAALVLASLGPGRVDSLVRWWLDLPRPVLRTSFFAAALIGGFLVYAGS